jgi:redox-sensing transcriptional repressor
MLTKPIPDIVVGRLPVYLRALSFLATEGIQTTSSHELGKLLGISAAQIRKDLSHFGESGAGRANRQLARAIRRISK